MFFRQLIDADLGCASYVIADAGEAIVVDPAIAIDQYLELACRHRFGIAHVVETHTHADHVSGNRRLATRPRAARPCSRHGRLRVTGPSTSRSCSATAVATTGRLRS